MNLNRKAVPIIGTLMLATAFMYAINGSPSNSIGFNVLEEGPTTSANGFAQEPRVMATDTVMATWQRQGQIAITTIGYQGCPVLPASVTIFEGTASVNLAVAARDLTCGPDKESYTTLVRLEDWDKHQDLRLEIRNEGI